MNKVVTIHLDGIAYSLEEGAYDALRAYLDAAEVTLSQNPDKDEIIRDLEQAIGTKLSAYLNAHKNVVIQSDIDAVLAEMGPVAAEGDTYPEGDAEKTANAAPAPKQLYRLKQNGVLFGVCAGLAAYFGVDVALVRFIFIILTFITGGGFAIVYVLAVIFIPEAHTSAEQAEAYGTAPLTAQDLVNRAKEGFNQFANSEQWHTWKQQMRQQRKQWRQERRAYRHMHRGYTWHDHPRGFLTELNEFIWSMFSLVVLVFFIWILYHHISLVHQFLDNLKTLWDRFIYALAQVISNHR
ncbi:MAG: PspC domain-containing protein [Minisyncoccia bacterium]|jgi:phage shock protein PspC (stress-responsive transcriptional regulator)